LHYRIVTGIHLFLKVVFKLLVLFPIALNFLELITLVEPLSSLRFVDFVADSVFDLAQIASLFLNFFLFVVANDNDCIALPLRDLLLHRCDFFRGHVLLLLFPFTSKPCPLFPLGHLVVDFFLLIWESLLPHIRHQIAIVGGLLVSVWVLSCHLVIN